jgi:hypothetical protein
MVAEASAVEDIVESIAVATFDSKVPVDSSIV